MLIPEYCMHWCQKWFLPCETKNSEKTYIQHVILLAIFTMYSCHHECFSFKCFHSEMIESACRTELLSFINLSSRGELSCPLIIWMLFHRYWYPPSPEHNSTKAMDTYFFQCWYSDILNISRKYWQMKSLSPKISTSISTVSVIHSPSTFCLFLSAMMFGFAIDQCN